MRSDPPRPRSVVSPASVAPRKPVTTGTAPSAERAERGRRQPPRRRVVDRRLRERVVGPDERGGVHDLRLEAPRAQRRLDDGDAEPLAEGEEARPRGGGEDAVGGDRPQAALQLGHALADGSGRPHGRLARRDRGQEGEVPVADHGGEAGDVEARGGGAGEGGLERVGRAGERGDHDHDRPLPGRRLRDREGGAQRPLRADRSPAELEHATLQATQEASPCPRSFSMSLRKRARIRFVASPSIRNASCPWGDASVTSRPAGNAAASSSCSTGG